MHLFLSFLWSVLVAPRRFSRSLLFKSVERRDFTFRDRLLVPCCFFVRLHTYVRVCMWLCVHVYRYIFINLYVSININTVHYLSVCVCICLSVSMPMRVRVCLCARALLRLQMYDFTVTRYLRFQQGILIDLRGCA